MSLWGSIDTASGNLKPKYANTNSKMAMANTVYGVSTTEKSNTQGVGPGLAHAGWNIIKVGSGPILSIKIISGGTGINAATGFLTVSGIGGATNANVSWATANSQNLLQTFSTNPAWNVINSVVINNPGLYGLLLPTVTYVGANTTRPVFEVVPGGRAGRVTSETLVAMGSMIGDNAGDDALIPGTPLLPGV